jgi:predicted MFS family arabinose efflux permease
VTVLASRVSSSLGGTAQGLFSASAGLATIAGSAAGGAIAGALGIAGNFAAWAVLGLIGAAILGYAVLAKQSGIGPAREDRVGSSRS